MGSKIHVIGNLTHDPEMVNVQSGSVACNIRLATSSTKRDANGTAPAIFYSARVFGKHAEACGKYLTKGSKVYITGDFEPSEYVDRDGATRMFLNINSANVEFLSTGGQQREQRASDSGQSKPSARQGASMSKTPPSIGEDEELPF